MCSPRHEKSCGPANLVCGQISPKMWTFWIKTTIIKDVGKKCLQINLNIMKYATQGKETIYLSPKSE